MAKTKLEPFIRISRKSDIKPWLKIVIKISAILGALLLCGIISNIIAPGSFFTFFENVFIKNFASTRRGVTTFSLQKTINLLWSTAILFLISLAVTPAFKMKFWNIGGEGQVLMGAFGALIIMKFVAPSINNNFISIILMLIVSVIFGAIWAFIPALLKVLFNTNETLFTLMLNYVAMAIVGFASYQWRATGTTSIGIVNSDTKLGWLPSITLWDGKAYDYIIGIFIVIGIAVFLWAYLKYFKQGYELSVVGGSRNTAKYAGININKVVIRTMIISGILVGICGWLLVSGSAHSINEDLVGGQGFTGVLVSWLGPFSPLEMAGYSFLVSFVSKGCDNASSVIGYSSFVGEILVALVFFFIIASELVINFNVHFNFKVFKKAKEEVKHE